MGLAPEGGDVGPCVIARLSGSASAYSVLSNGQGETLLVCSSDIGGILDPGRTSSGSTGIRSTFDLRSKTEPAYAKQRSTLRTMQQANKAAWGLS
jgi:hypothetical protein